MSRPKCHRSVISLKSFFAVLQSRLHKEFWLLIYPVDGLIDFVGRVSYTASRRCLILLGLLLLVLRLLRPVVWCQN